jgi:hypothetical protein
MTLKAAPAVNGKAALISVKRDRGDDNTIVVRPRPTPHGDVGVAVSHPAMIRGFI